MTNHFLFQEDLKAYADGELAWPRRLTIRLHLTRCASCREEFTHMTQLAEDLRASEPADPLDPALRAKILALAPGAEEEPRVVPFPSRGATSSRKKPTLGWALAGAAVMAWFVFFPMFQKVHENSQRFSSTGAAFKQEVREAPGPVAVATVPKQKAPPQLTVRLSNREAGRDIDGRLIRSSGSGGSYPGGGAPIAVTGGGVSLLNGIAPDALQRQVHKEASIGIQVPNPEAVSDKVADMVKETGGFVASNTLDTGDDGLKSAVLTVKVPVTQFETFLSQVAKLGSVQSKNISGEDITEKTSDADQTENVLESDVQQSEARLKALRSKAKWSDQQATRDLRTQLAEARARLVLLKRMAALATVTIDLSQTPKPPAQVPVTGGFLTGLKASTHDAVQSLIGSASALAALVIWLLAYAPIWVPFLLVGRYAVREYRKRQAA